MASEKIVNYTAEQTQEMVATYTASPTEETVKALAEKFGRTTKSVISKLAKEQVYQAKTKIGARRAMLKAEMVTEIAKLLEVSEDKVESLEKATGPALSMVMEALRAAKAAD